MVESVVLAGDGPSSTSSERGARVATKKTNGNGNGVTQTLDSISNSKIRSKFNYLCQQIRQQKDIESEAKDTASTLMQEASKIAAKHHLVKLYGEGYLWLRTAGRKGQVKEQLLQQNLLKMGLDIGQINKVIEESRGPDGSDYYQVRGVKE